MSDFEQLWEDIRKAEELVADCQKECDTIQEQADLLEAKMADLQLELDYANEQGIYAEEALQSAKDNLEFLRTAHEESRP